MKDPVRSKLPNCKLGISNVVTRKDRNKFNKNVFKKHAILDFPNFVKRTK